MRRVNKIFKLVIITNIIIFSCLSCSIFQREYNDKQWTLYNIGIFKSNPNWKLALAVKDQDLNEIEELSKTMDINTRDSILGFTLLSYSIYNDKYNSAKKLLELGADPSIKGFKYYKNSKYPYFDYDMPSEISPLYWASGHPYTTKYAELLLKYGAKIDINCDSSNKDHIESGMLEGAVSNFEILKLLEQYGGDVHFFCKKHGSPILLAAIHEKIDIVNYLLFEKKVDVIYPYTYLIDSSKDYFVDKLRSWEFDLDSKKYKQKMEIVKFIKEKYNLDYYKAPIPMIIRKIHNKEYLKKY
jgi:hypothetical protein